MALSPFGPSQAGRFYGLSNLLATMLLLPTLLGTALLGAVGVLVAAAAAVMVGGSRFGADGGGLLVLLAGFVTLWLAKGRGRLDARRAAVLAVAVVIAAVAAVAIDAALGGSSHVTDAIGDGPRAVLGDLADRWEISIRRSLALGTGAGLRPLSRRARMDRDATTPAPVTTALLVALAVSLLVNDTPGDVLSTGAVAAITLWRFETCAVRRTG